MSDTEQRRLRLMLNSAEAPTKTDADRVSLLEAKNLELKEEKQKWRDQVEELQGAIQSMEKTGKRKRSAMLTLRLATSRALMRTSKALMSKHKARSRTVH